MKVKRVAVGPLRTNCYLLLNEAEGQALLIDPGPDPEPALEILSGFALQAILLTHGHWDHIYGVEQVKSATGAPVWISEIEREWLTNPMLNRSGLRTSLLGRPCAGPPPDRLLSDGDTFTFSGQEFHVIHTPGHTPGSLSFWTKGLLFSGDTLFRGSVGRTDLPGSSTADLLRAIRQKLFSLPDDTLVAPGHGLGTTIGREKRTNPFTGQ